MGVEGDHEVAVAERGRDDRAVVLLFAEAEREALALGRLGDCDQHLVVLVGHAGAVDDERHADGGQHAVDRAHGASLPRRRSRGGQPRRLQRDQVGSRFDGPVAQAAASPATSPQASAQFHRPVVRA